ncbi:MAG TPA: hypothetical protein VFE98_08390 [Candidatus Bathyarchaeia archaeon]|nr:hypothetical protein [Candidatus Bathyarchaeia archaeon]
MSTPRQKTGTSELDEILRGGFLEGDAVMVAGSVWVSAESSFGKVRRYVSQGCRET